MILITKKRLFWFAFASGSFSIAMGITGYMLLKDTNQLAAETLLIMMIIGLLTCGALLAGLLRTAKSAVKQLKRSLLRSRASESLTSAGPHNKGTDELLGFYGSLLENNIKRERKIGLLASLVAYLAESHDQLVFVCTGTGEIVYKNSRAIEKLKIQDKGSYQDLVSPGAFNALLQELFSTQAAIKTESPAGKLYAHPIFQEPGVLAYCIFTERLTQSEALLSKAESKTNARRRSFSKRLMDLLAGKKTSS